MDTGDTMGTSVHTLMGRRSMDFTAPLPEPCQRRADVLRKYALERGYEGRRRDDSVLARVLSYDVFAFHEFPGVAIADATDLALCHPEFADFVWHHTAGAAILAMPICECPHPAFHRDALIEFAHHLNGDRP